MSEVKIDAISPRYQQPTSFLAGFVSFLGRLPISCRKPISFLYTKDIFFLHDIGSLPKNDTNPAKNQVGCRYRCDIAPIFDFDIQPISVSYTQPILISARYWPDIGVLLGMKGLMESVH